MITKWTKKKMTCFEDGEPIAVARPDKPDRAVELVKAAHADPAGKDPETADAVWQALEDKLNATCSPYTFMGYLAKTKRGSREEAPILDENGERIGVTMPGDSFIRESEWVDEQ